MKVISDLHARAIQRPSDPHAQPRMSCKLVEAFKSTPTGSTLMAHRKTCSAAPPGIISDSQMKVYCGRCYASGL